nr:L,D-transpeptidase [Sinimarinibacterium sp. NLF-5-8]
MSARARIEIDLSAQRLTLWQGGARAREYLISSAANGLGEIGGSGKTPRGAHIIRARIGSGLPQGAVLRARRWTGELWSPALAAAQPGRDWILSRILWLSGTEIGRNRLGCVDTFRRYIYLHGTPDVAALGTPASHGCIRMRCADIIELFDLVNSRTQVELHA